MCRKNLLHGITKALKNAGFVEDNSKSPMTYQSNVMYSGLFPDKRDYAHFVLYTSEDTIQLAAKFQQSTGTAIEKLAYTAMDAARTKYDRYVVICGGDELLKHNRAINFLNSQKDKAPRLHALDLKGLEEFLVDSLKTKAA